MDASGKDAAPAGPGREKKATLRDIARLCGVSPMAVSMALNHKPGVSKKTAERIWKAIRKVNYTPNLVAKSLRVNSTRTIGVVVSDSSHLLFSRIIKVIGDLAEEAGYSIVMANTEQNPERERRAIDTLLNKRIDGLLLAAPILPDDGKIAEAVDFGLPVVMIMRTSTLAVDSVSADNYAGAYAMVDYLAGSGGGAISMINLPRNSQSGRERLRGYRRALRDNGLKNDPRRLRHANPQIADGRRAMDGLLDEGLAEGAVFCGCDLIAVGALEAARRRGVAVPERVRIAGFDDIDMLDHLAVPLTTMRQPVEEMARRAFAMLLERIGKEAGGPRRVILPSELIVRKST